jgi:hypothetical protein
MTMKTSEVLRRVREHLGDEGWMWAHERYTCYALDFLYFKARVIGDKDRTRVKRLVRQHLGDAPSLEIWLVDNHGVKFTNTHAYIKKIMATRKAWLTHLIEHYSHKGD